MKNKSRLFRVVGAAALLISMLAATVAPAAAQDEGTSQDWLDALIGAEGVGFLEGNNAIYYPWVANDDDFGLGAADTSISVQNLEDSDTVISIYVGNGAGDFDLVTTAFLSAYASKTFHASALGLAEGEGAPVAVISFNEVSLVGYPGVPEDLLELVPAGTLALVETPIILSNPVADDETDGENDGGDFTQVLACVVNYHLSASPNLGTPWGYVAVVDHEFNGTDYDAGEWVSFDGVANVQAALQAALNLANEGNEDELINPFGGLNADADCFDAIDAVSGTFNDGVAIGGVAKQAVEGESLPATGETDTAVSGYNAINGAELYYFGEWHLPIVQTNCGPGGCWDSVIRVGNFDEVNNAVEIRFFPASDGSGSLQTGFQLQANVNGGDTWEVNLSDYVPEGWVGTAHIYTDGAVFPMVDRYKVGYNMWITNTGSSADFEQGSQLPNANGRYALFAPHVLMDYYGWNTGINVANLVGEDNNISIQYFNMFGNATQVLDQRLAAHGMTYFYDPSIAAQDNNSQDVTTDPNAGVVGSAIIWSEHPVAAAVDATKYPETDPNGGADLFQATSYSATANIFPWQAVPLVQKGAAIDGMGDTSGINIMNPNAVAATANVYWVNPSGFQADNFGVGSVTIPAFANGFVYTLWQQNLPNGFTGAAQVVANVPVAAVSANVNYEVDGDGSAIFNAFNPCGFYRTAWPCSFGDVLEPGGQSVTKYFIVDDEDGEDETTISEDAIGIQGVNFSIVSTSGAGYQRDGISGTDGSGIFTNVPVGTYELYVTGGVPGDFLDPGDEPLDTFVVAEGEDVVLVNELEYAQGFTKNVCVEQFNGILVPVEGAAALQQDEEPEFDCGEGSVGLSGIDIVVYENIGEDFLGAPVIGDIVFEGQTGDDGSVSGNLPSGNYILCMYDADGEAVTTNGETVNPALPDEATVSLFCATELLGEIEFDIFGDMFTVESGIVTELDNPVFLQRGTINMFVGDGGIVVAQTGSEDMEPVAGVEVCIESEEYYDPELDELTMYQECATSDADGNISFPGAPGWGVEGIAEFGGGIGLNSDLQGLEEKPVWFFDSMEYSAEIYSDEYTCEFVEGGELTANVYNVLCGFSTFDESSASLQQGEIPVGSFWFDYSPTADVVQDGYSDDEGQDEGSYDIVIEVEELINGVDG